MREQNEKKAQAIRENIAKNGAKSAWARGVNDYALELLDNFQEWADYEGEELTLGGASYSDFEEMALNGAENWQKYSWGACSLIYNEDIARRLCSPSELKKNNNGQRCPNHFEQWLDTQARALSQAARALYKAWKIAEL